MLPEWTVVGFSGHRSLVDPAATAARIGELIDGLVASHGPIVAVSSLAKGSDAAFVAEAAKRKVPFLLVLPFPEARFQQDFQPAEWASVTPLLAQASHVEQAEAAESDDEAYMETGVRIVDQADVMIVVWDGKPTAGLGGTGDVVAYARAMHKPIEWLNPDTGRVVAERLESVPQPGAAAGPAPNPHQALEQHFRELDDTASAKAPKVRHLIQRIVLLHLVAALFGLIALTLDLRGLPAYAVAMVEVAVLALAFTLTAMRQHGHKEWMRTRIEAEVCRSFLATWPMRGRISGPPRLSIQGFDRFTRNLRLMQLTDRSQPPSLEAACDAYLRGRIENQIDYFSRRCDVSQRAYARLKGMAMVSTAFAALFAAGHLVLSLAHVEGLPLTATVSLSLVLPLLSAALLSLVLTHEHARRAARYREMVGLLEEAVQRLKAVRTWNGLTRIALATEDALLNEAVEWHSFRRFASEPH